MKKYFLLCIICLVCCLIIQAQSRQIITTDLSTLGVTPESFGCKGDSITDDTENLQKAINFCKTNKRMLISSKGKIYAISHPLDITNPGEMQIDFGGAEIKAIKPMKYIIKYDNGKDFSTNHNNIINNIVLNCNNMSGGFYCPAAIKTSFNFIMIRNCSKIAFQALDGYEIFLTNSHIHCNEERGTYGIYITTGDSHFDNIIIIDAQTAVYQKTQAVNFYDKIHAWVYKMAESTIFFDVEGLALLNQCYCDTAEKGYVMHAFSILKLINCQSYNNTECYDSPNDPVLFYFANEKVVKESNVSCIACNFNSGGVKGTKLSNYDSQRIQFTDCSIDPSIIGNPGKFVATAAEGIELIANQGNITDNTMGFLCPDKDKGNHIYLDAKVLSNNKANEIKIAILPKEYTPTNDSYASCITIREDGTYSQEPVKISKTDGAVYIYPSYQRKKQGVTQVIIDMNYKY